jgi:hypothetical protein
MGGFLFKGLDGHVGHGVPWPMQNGLFCASFYHFFVHDTDGIIGNMVRRYGYPLFLRNILKWDDKMYAGIFVSIFMQVTGWLQLPYFYGPAFSPFEIYTKFCFWVMSPLTAAILATTTTRKQPQPPNDDIAAASQRPPLTTTNGGGGGKKSKPKKKKEQ